jgi:hypothetical protein
MKLKLIHQQWQLVGTVLIVDNEGNALELGKDAQGQSARVMTVNIPVARFRGNEFENAYGQARVACEQLLAQIEQAQGPASPLDQSNDNQIEDTAGERPS